ncbi:VOC family protein [Hymenobacter terrigena]
MKKMLCSATFGLLMTLSSAGSAFAQSTPTVSHVALYVFDLQKSVDFYGKVLQLQQIPEPFKDGRHVWFRMGPHSQLHIIQGAAKVEPHDKNLHLAFSVKDLKKFTAHLDKLGTSYGSWAGLAKESTARPDGVKQVYLQDPDNYWVEVNDDAF